MAEVMSDTKSFWTIRLTWRDRSMPNSVWRHFQPGFSTSSSIASAEPANGNPAFSTGLLVDHVREEKVVNV